MAETLTYQEKLLDPRWQRKRLLIFVRDNWMCRKCNCSDRNLQIHHNYYLPETEPWNYPDEALMTLCFLCHEKVEIFKWIRKTGLRNLINEGFPEKDCFDIYRLAKKNLEDNHHPESARRYINDLKTLMSA